MKYRSEADKVPELEADNKRLHFEIQDLEVQNHQMSNSLSQAQADYHIKVEEIKRVVPNPNPNPNPNRRRSREWSRSNTFLTAKRSSGG